MSFEQCEELPRALESARVRRCAYVGQLCPPDTKMSKMQRSAFANWSRPRNWQEVQHQVKQQLRGATLEVKFHIWRERGVCR